MFTNFSWIHIEVLLQGLVWTVLLSIIAFIFGGLLGFAVALAGIAKNKALVALVDGYTVLVQGTPVLILMFIVYFGLPVFGIEVSSLFAASVAMTIFASAFLGAIWRGSLQSVPRTQWEASDCLALTGLQGLFLVIMPQAIRIATPPTVGFMVQIVKNTSLASIIGMAEMTYIGKEINASTFQPFTTYLVIAFFYFCICFPLSAASRKFERMYSASRR
ncbi:MULTISPECIES: amino acid ABC transporter permease [Brucella]|uniref:Polar amino acid ABC transporter, inner membrane subunit n=1 Tax=Ochrobactrum soli TaxID=2448455 RepID=A0A2P9HCQ2_9HYPH|nr:MULTISPECIES: amino acid ABC transporter permease [Brucella]MDX4071911.1 amino acid ABC transporter permease [Brucella sp. NBRC 113783]RRD26426.1 amino acid ABC transporter permease [Brucellaceae bacterium VT-16-1752]SPL61845.1 polar amino acid ABC transporter, inner membrane subunit [[Ochrobactrum] soli]